MAASPCLSDALIVIGGVLLAGWLAGWCNTKPVPPQPLPLLALPPLPVGQDASQRQPAERGQRQQVAEGVAPHHSGWVVGALAPQSGRRPEEPRAAGVALAACMYVCVAPCHHSVPPHTPYVCMHACMYVCMYVCVAPCHPSVPLPTRPPLTTHTTSLLALDPAHLLPPPPCRSRSNARIWATWRPRVRCTASGCSTWRRR